MYIVPFAEGHRDVDAALVDEVVLVDVVVDGLKLDVLELDVLELDMLELEILELDVLEVFPVDETGCTLLEVLLVLAAFDVWLLVWVVLDPMLITLVELDVTGLAVVAAAVMASVYLLNQARTSGVASNHVPPLIDGQVWPIWLT